MLNGSLAYFSRALRFSLRIMLIMLLVLGMVPMSHAISRDMSTAANRAASDNLAKDSLEGIRPSKCIRISEHDIVPREISREQCYELQGGNVIDHVVSIHGRLFIKAGRQVTLQGAGAFVLQPGSNMEIRGAVELQQGTQITVDDQANLIIMGLLQIRDQAALSSRLRAEIKSQGRLLLEDGALIRINGQSAMRQSGELVMRKALFEVREQSSLFNGGTIRLSSEATIKVEEQSSLRNFGRILSSQGSLINLSQKATLQNRRTWALNGTLSLHDGVIFTNEAPFRTQPGSTVNMYGAAQFLNKHSFDIAGKMLLITQSRLLNHGTVAIKHGGEMGVGQHAVFINNGTLRNEGGSLTIESSNNFINQNIISGSETKRASER